MNRGYVCEEKGDESILGLCKGFVVGEGRARRRNWKWPMRVDRVRGGGAKTGLWRWAEARM